MDINTKNIKKMTLEELESQSSLIISEMEEIMYTIKYFKIQVESLVSLWKILLDSNLDITFEIMGRGYTLDKDYKPKSKWKKVEKK